MKKILILSKNIAEASVPHITNSNAVISITDPDSKNPAKFTVNNYTKDVLYIKCYDIDGRNDRTLECLPEKYRNGLFTDEHAKEVLTFVDNIKNDIDTLVCHCDAGISRSAGVAAAISLIFMGSDSRIFNSKKYIPNMFVYRKILNNYYGEIK